jgi:hypothetical protein
MAKSSQAAIDLIVMEEASNEAYYTRHYTHFEWPAGASGPTVGIGYDCGYVTEAELIADWSGIVSDETLHSLRLACGIRGGLASNFVRLHGQSVTITWPQAIAQFTGRELPKWENRVVHTLPNADELTGDSFGALVSLSYNRGTGGFFDPGPRYVEMRAIRTLMESKQFQKVPAQFLAMRRLWPVDGDLWNRREHEANLFTKGLMPVVAS